VTISLVDHGNFNNFQRVGPKKKKKKKKPQSQSQTELVSETHLGKIPFQGRFLPTTTRGGRKALGRRESANEAN
jgi:hypothetical protein